ncbi:MAG: electron transfer flavoprotein subunit alpha/FixB family protein [bacterium JZ-2024 1]
MAGAILVIAEHHQGAVTGVTYEVLGGGRRVADALRVPLVAFLAGQEARTLASQLRMADVVYINEAGDLWPPIPSHFASAIKQVMEIKGTQIVLIPGTNFFLGVGSSLSAKTGLPCVNFCCDVRVENEKVEVTSSVLGGKMMADLILPEAGGILSVIAGVFSPETVERSAHPIVETGQWSGGSGPIQFERYIEPESGDVDITQQEVLVAVGRGIQNADNLALAEELAQVLGGAVCGSRPVVDQGWLPLTRQVGKSGMTVKPRLYLALGISGAPEHTEGMKNSDLILAINTDPSAPIFGISHFGVCADMFEVLPPLIAECRRRKGG